MSNMEFFDLQIPSNMLFLGSTKSGKTTLLKKLIFCQFLHKTDFILVLSTTNYLNKDYEFFEEIEDHTRFMTRHSNFEKHIQEIVDQQEKSIIRKGAQKTPQVMIICDDTLGENMLNFRGIIDKLAPKARHLNISLVILIQYMKMTPVIFRNNARYIFAFSCTNFRSLEQFLEEFCPQNLRKSFRKMVSKIYSEPFTFVFCQCFFSNPMERLWVFDPTLKHYENLMKTYLTENENPQKKKLNEKVSVCEPPSKKVRGDQDSH